MVVTHVRASWVDQIIQRLDRTLSRTPVTKTEDNITGAESLTEGAAADILGAFVVRQRKWAFDKGGLLETADAYVIVKDTQALNKNDKITVDGKSYRADNVITRYTDDNQNTAVYKYAVLYLIS